MAHDVDFSTGSQPLKGVVLCFTSITQDERTRLVDVASQMGADCNLDLTSAITHLIVGSICTPKYRYVAKERPDVRVLHPDWIEAVRLSWMEGGEVDVTRLEKSYAIPTFRGLHICLTGFHDDEHRNYLSSTIEAQGATYHGDLTRYVTHLIAAAPQGEKYTYGRKWEISVVSLKWFEDSLARGMILDEGLYDPSMAIEDQGKDAFVPCRPRTSLGKHGRDGEGKDAALVDPSRKKLRRSASSRLEGQSQGMWTDFSAWDAMAEPIEADQWKDDGQTRTLQSEFGPKSAGSNLKEETSTTGAGAEQGGLFSRCRIFVDRFEENKKAHLERVLQVNGATFTPSLADLEADLEGSSDDERFVLVPHTSNFPDTFSRATVVTEWWVERCVHNKRFLRPADHVLNSPLGGSTDVDFTKLIVSTTGFTGVELRQAAEAVKFMGATYEENIKPICSVLVSGAADIRKEKAYYASKHGIPVVYAEWLWECVKTRELASIKDYQLKMPVLELKDLSGDVSGTSPANTAFLPSRNADASKKKGDVRPQRLSNVRRKHLMPSLSLTSIKSEPIARQSKAGPFVLEDEDDPPTIGTEPIAAPTVSAISQSRSQPLQEASPNVSPQRTETDTKLTSKSLSRPVSPRQPQLQTVDADADSQERENQIAPRSRYELAADLADIINKQKTSRPGSAVPTDPLPRPKSRPLGRASSGISSRSHSNPISATRAPKDDTSSFPSDHLESVAPSNSVEAALQPPSTQLGYETPEAEEHRLQMSKKMGIKDEFAPAGMMRVAGLGLVKDNESLAAGFGVANRVKMRKGRER